MTKDCRAFTIIKESLVKDKHLIIDTELIHLEKVAFELGASKAIIISPKEDLIFDERAKLLCFNCKHYGIKHSCPTKIPSLNYEKVIKSFDKGIIIIVEVEFENKEEFDKVRIDSTNKLHKILLKLEKISFDQGNYFTTSFIGGSCKLCPNGCAEKCRNPSLVRIPMEATGLNVIDSLKKFGINLTFPVKDYNRLSRVGLLLSGK